MKTVRQEASADGGKKIEVVGWHVELATGLNRWEAHTGRWEPAGTCIEAFAGGFVARGTAHRVIWPRRLGADALVDLVDGEGLRYRSRVLGLAWFETVTGRRVWIGRTQVSCGELVREATLVYANAFEGVFADLAYVNRLDGLAQEVILREALPEPSLWGLDPTACRLEVWTEFVEAPPVRRQSRIPPGSADDEDRSGWSEPAGPDEAIGFGAYGFGPGRAFDLGAGRDRAEDVPVARRWTTWSGRTVLIESAEWRWIGGASARLPVRGRDPGGAQPVVQPASEPFQLPDPVPMVQAEPFSDRLEDCVASGRNVPRFRSGFETTRGGSRRSVRRSRSTSGKPAGLEAGFDRPGFVLDYELVASQADFTFAGDTTYALAGPVRLTGTTILEGGAVIKFPPGRSDARIHIEGRLECRTDAHRPAFFTARDDDTVGTMLPESSHAPTGLYGGYALVLEAGAEPADLRHLCFREVAGGVRFAGNGPHRLRHAQMTGIRYGVGADSAGTVRIENVLMTGFAAGGRAIQITGTPAQVRAAHLTVDSASELANWRITLHNSLVINTPAGAGHDGDPNGILPSAQGAFVRAGGGSWYLPSDSPHRQAGTEGIDAGLLAELRTRTTRAPFVWDQPIHVPTVWRPRGLMNPGPPDLGYHYPVLDHLVRNLALAANLTLSDGVAVGLTGSFGFELRGGGGLTGAGRPDALSRVVSQANVQESTTPEPGNRFLRITSSDRGRELEFRFTEFSIRQGARGGLFEVFQADPFRRIRLRDCQLRAASIYLNPQSDGEVGLVFVNNLFDRCDLTLHRSSANTPTAVELYNNLFRGGVLGLRYESARTYRAWQVRDNLFDRTGIGASGDAWSGYINVSHNAFTSGTDNPLGGHSNQTGLVPDFQNGPLGPWYYPGSGGATSLARLSGTGSRSAPDAGLYHHTTRVDQTPQGNAPGNIGFHYVALDVVTGRPPDSDGDGLPDHVEDANGNGRLDPGETDFRNADTDYDGRNDLEERLEQTDPTDPASAEPARLGWWRFDLEADPWRGERGQLPLHAAGIQHQPGSFIGGALEIAAPDAHLRFREIEADARANINLRQGAVRLWFKPGWSSQGSGGTGPGHRACLFAVGRHGNAATGWFDLAIAPDGRTLRFSAHDGADRQVATSGPIALRSSIWHEIMLSYGRRPAGAGCFVRLFLDGFVVAQLEEPTADLPYPPPATRATGFTLGCGPDGGEAAGGWIDEFETFNHPLGRAAASRSGRVIACRAPDHAPGLELEWRTNPNQTVRIERRSAGEAAWTTLATGVHGWSWRDATVVPGTFYDYRVTPEGTGPGRPLEVRAVRDGAAVRDRGRVILLVEQSLATALAPEIQRLEHDLAGDGWQVVLHHAARHDDDDWANNPPRIAAIKRFILDTWNADPVNTRGIFILGHVAIPYSGIAIVPDGHPEHQGAWPADLFYGSPAPVAPTGDCGPGAWTDCREWPGYPATRPNQVNAPGDGKFDQDLLPAVDAGQALALFVGRVDFARLPAFAGELPPGVAARSETDLLRAYLDKNHAFRHGRLPFPGRIVTMNYLYDSLLDESYAFAWRNQAAVSDLDPVSLLAEDLFTWPVAARFGIQLGWGNYDAINVLAWTGHPRHSTTELARGEKQPAVAVALLDGSYLGDWDSLNNVLRALLTSERGGLAAAYAGFVEWDFRQRRPGACLGDALFAPVTMAHPDAYIALLGDPTLPLEVVMPPVQAAAVRAGHEVRVAWLPANAAVNGYLVERSQNGLEGPFDLLAEVPATTTGFVDPSPPSGPGLYRIRSVAWVRQGEGRSSGLSQGVIARVEP